MSNLISHALGMYARKPAQEFHTCDSCVNKAAAAGAIELMGAATRLAQPALMPKYLQFEEEVLAGWKAASKRHFEEGTFGPDMSVFMGANLMAMQALLTQWADIACNGMSPLDRVGWMSGVARAAQMLAAAGTFALHNDRNPGAYTQDQADNVLEGILDNAIPKHVLLDIGEAWADWSEGEPQPTPRDFVHDSEAGSTTNLRDLLPKNAPKAVLDVLDKPEPDDIDGKFARAKELYEATKVMFPVGHPLRSQLDESFKQLEKLYLAQRDIRNTSEPITPVAGLTESTYTPVDTGNPATEAGGMVGLAFDHEPSVEEIAQATYNQIKAAHPQAKITVEQIIGALQGKVVAGVQVIRFNR